MSAKVNYQKDSLEKEHENVANVTYNVDSRGQKYQNESGQKNVEKHCTVKYVAGGTSNTSTETLISSPIRHAKKKSVTGSTCTQSSQPKSVNTPAISAKCYETRRGVKRSCTPAVEWHKSKYCRDECGSGIVANRFDFMPARKIWCKTPLTLYQATVGELGRKILCREKVVPRDVKPAPPCNIGEYILPLCRGYYRKYDCLRPCEEEYAVKKNGKKQYRDCVQRYWEPCQSDWQKHKLNLNEYAPQNSFLATKLRRKNLDVTSDVPCW